MRGLSCRFPTSGSLAACRVIQQSSKVDAHLPFRAPNGVIVVASPTGLPFIAMRDNQLTIALRKPGVEPLGEGLEYGGRAADFGTTIAAQKAARLGVAAIKALRAAL